MSVRDRVALPDVRKWSGGTSGSLGVVGKLSQMLRSGREALPEVLEWSGVFPNVRE